MLVEEALGDGRYEGRAAHQARRDGRRQVADRPLALATCDGPGGGSARRTWSRRASPCAGRRGGPCPAVGPRGSPPRPAAPPASSARRAWVNVANVLTVVRICLVPIFVFCLVPAARGGEWRPRGVRRRLGDRLLDGKLARRRGLVTDFGKIADPIADKALTGAALITLSALGELPGWVTALILFRELGITVLRFAVIRRGVIAASQGGKLKTVLQISRSACTCCPPSLGPPAIIKEVVMGAALVVTLVTGAGLRGTCDSAESRAKDEAGAG